MKSPVTPSPGRIVIVELDPLARKHNGGNQNCPGIITNVITDEKFVNSEVNIKLILDSPFHDWYQAIPYSEGNEPGTWHYPPRV